MTWLSDAAVARLAAITAVPDADPGATRYELIEPIGRGGMGVVWRARDRALGRDVALKLLDADSASPAQAERRARLLREAEVLARLEHPGIVPVHDAGTLPDGRVYYAMKLVRGRRLDDEVRAGRSLNERLRVFGRLCEAVAFAHAQGVLHRDLKPENVMVGAFGEVLVLDWGVARATRTERDAHAGARPARADGTAHGTVLGTPGYMAPEQARGEVAGLDARADVYALGGVLHFLLSERAPDDDTAGASPRLPRSVPARLAAIVRKARADEPAARYDSVPALAQDVTRFLAGEPVDAYPESALDKARRLAARHRTALLLLLTYVSVRALLLALTGR